MKLLILITAFSLIIKSLSKNFSEIKNPFLDNINYEDDELYNQRYNFIKSKKSPVLVIPGLLATSLRITIKCKNFIAELSEDQKNLFVKYCINNNVCAGSVEEDIKLWPSIGFTEKLSMIKFFSIYENTSNECMSFLMRYSNYYENKLDKNLPKQGNFSFTHRSKNIKITPYFANKNSNNCGFDAINNIGISFDNYTPTKGFIDLYEALKLEGYEPGFSMAAIAYDFKESHCKSDTAFAKLFNEIINNLYINTGRRVVIVAHSYGNLNTLQQLSNNINNISTKIAHFVSIASPYLGSHKTIQLLTTGSNDFIAFDSKLLKVEVNYRSQLMLGGFFNAGYMLLPRHYSTAVDIFDKNYKCFIKYWKSLIKDKNLIKSISPMFNNIKKIIKTEKSSTLACKKLDNFIKEVNFDKKKHLSKKSYSNSRFVPINKFCEIEVFDYDRCPIIQINNNKLNEIAENMIKHKNELLTDCFSEFLDVKDKYYLSDYCYENICPFPKLTDFLGKHVGKNIDNDILKSKIIKYSLLAINKKEYSCTKSLNNPKIATTLIYNRSLYTRSAYNFKLNKDSEFDMLDQFNTYYSGGDGTVSADSALFGPLKWAYEYKNIKNRNYKPINIVDYCSSIQEKDVEDYNINSKIYNPLIQNYMVLDCSCKIEGQYHEKYISSNGEYMCNHTNMHSDPKLVQFIIKILSSQPFKEDSIFIKKALDNIKKLKGKSCWKNYYKKWCFDIYNKY